ncbi:MAG: Ribosome maturation factor RimM [Deltaproteobacteria bacterium ADurb.Bin510]|nr:MAG: Ribosome maturation factor RimM [Deltaproteobacteria bacterium ADurb.Bin510]
MSDKLLAIARIKAPQGLAGKMWISPLGQADNSFLQGYSQILIGRQGAPRSVVSIAKRNKGFVLELAGITSSDQVELLLGETLYIDRAWLPEPEEDEFYAGDLVGLRVVALSGEELGRVTQVFSTGASDVLEIDGRSMIPLVEAFVKEIDLDQGQIIIDTAEIGELLD